jgi:hypothetical protein
VLELRKELAVGFQRCVGALVGDRGGLGALLER